MEDISHLLIMVRESDKVAITHLAIRETDHVVGAEKVPEQNIWENTVHAIF